jgi:uncharacterized protein with PIN domain
MEKMKKMIILALTIVLATTSIFAQEKAGKKDTIEHVIYYCGMHPDVKSDEPGTCPKCGMELLQSKKEQMKARVMKIYTCPMHPDVKSNKPGKCSKCGMDLVEKKKAKPKKSGS